MNVARAVCKTECGGSRDDDVSRSLYRHRTVGADKFGQRSAFRIFGDEIVGRPGSVTPATVGYWSRVSAPVEHRIDRRMAEIGGGLRL